VNVAGALLAAGRSSRFGRAKAFAELDGVTFLRRLAGELAAVASPVLVVAPPDSARYEREIEDLDVSVVTNPDPERGMGSSIAAAAGELARAAPGADALLVALVDQPRAERAHFARLIEAAAVASGWAASDYGGGVFGPPALFPRAAFAALARLDGDHGARDLLAGAGAELALVDFPDGRFDVDTPADYERLVASGSYSPPAAGKPRT
jgi:molybdenum cofactor cytidylyltransferase